AVAYETARDVGCARPLRVRGHDDRGGEVADVRGDRNLADQLAEREHVRSAEDPVHRGRTRLRGPVNDGVQLLDLRIAHAQLEKEALVLALGPRARAFDVC